MTGKFTVPGDIGLKDDGTDFVLATGVRAVVQQIEIGSQVFRSSWRFDQNHGLPWLISVLVKAPDLGAAQHMYRSFLAGIDGVSQVEYVRLRIDRPVRVLSIAFRIRLDTGEIVEETIYLGLE